MPTQELFVKRVCRSSRSHAHLAIALTAQLNPAESGRVDAELDGLAATLQPLWDLSPREQLVGCAAAMAMRFTPCGDHSLDDLVLNDVLARRVGHPLLLAIVAADVGRRAGLPLGLVGRGHEQHLAHVVLAEPVVADPRQGFALVDLAGREDTVRWPGPNEVAATLLSLIAGAARRSGSPEYAERVEELRRPLPITVGAA
jgi:hypothetical protein